MIAFLTASFEVSPRPLPRKPFTRTTVAFTILLLLSVYTLFIAKGLGILTPQKSP
jgi:hypothetical protein